MRAASRSEAGRLTGVHRSNIGRGLNKVESGEIWRASVGIEFRDVSVVKGKRGEHWARGAAPRFDTVEVSNLGRVRDAETKRLRPGTKAGSYVLYRIGEDRIFLHDLVLLTWEGLAPPDKPVRHGVEFTRVASMERLTRCFLRAGSPPSPPPAPGSAAFASASVPASRRASTSLR